MHIIIIYTTMLMLLTLSVEANDSLQTKQATRSYNELFGGLMFGVSTGTFNDSVNSANILRKFNFYIGKRFSPRCNVIIDFFDFGPAIKREPQHRSLQYFNLGFLNSGYYILPDENLSASFGIGLAIRSDVIFQDKNIDPTEYKQPIQAAMKFSVAYIPKELWGNIRFELGYNRNFIASDLEVGGQLLYQFAFLSIGLNGFTRD